MSCHIISYHIISRSLILSLFEYQQTNIVNLNKKRIVLLSNLSTCLNPCIHPCTSSSFAGQYELHSIVTHKGRSADSGHYIGWARQEPGSDYWWKYDDEVVTETTTEEVMKLKGGGDRDIAYLMFYRFKDFKSL